jgi:hypothetical protein
MKGVDRFGVATADELDVIVAHTTAPADEEEA